MKPTALVRLRVELKKALEAAARDQNRSLSNLIETAMDEWAKEKGYLKPKETKK